MITLKRVSAVLMMLLIFFAAGDIYGKKCGGCGGRVRSGRSSGSSGGYSSRGRSRMGSGRSSSDADKVSPMAESIPVGVNFSFFGWLVFLLLRRKLGLYSFNPKKCKCPLEDHVLNWRERIVLLLFMCTPMLLLIVFCDVHPAGLLLCIVGSIIFWALDYWR